MNRILSHSVPTQTRNCRVLHDWEKRRLVTVFHDCDVSNRGFLLRRDLKVAMVVLFGYKPSKYETDELFQGVAANEGLSMERFVNLMTSKITQEDRDDHIRQVFMTIDTHCRGFLTVDDLRRAFSEIAPLTPSHRIQTLFSEIDRDGDGRVSYQDFQIMMKFEEGW